MGYNAFTLNGRMLGHGEPVSVKHGERVLFHILNGSATEIRSLALPGHTFQVVALDGNPVPNAVAVRVLWLREYVSLLQLFVGQPDWRKDALKIDLLQMKYRL